MRLTLALIRLVRGSARLCKAQPRPSQGRIVEQRQNGTGQVVKIDGRARHAACWAYEEGRRARSSATTGKIGQEDRPETRRTRIASIVTIWSLIAGRFPWAILGMVQGGPLGGHGRHDGAIAAGVAGWSRPAWRGGQRQDLISPRAGDYGLPKRIPHHPGYLIPAVLQTL